MCVCVCLFLVSSAMAAVGRTDEMIRDYLLFRGFTSTLKAFDTDLKNEREKGFRVSTFNFISRNRNSCDSRLSWSVLLQCKMFCKSFPQADRVLDQLHSYVNTYDIVGLKEYWSFLDSRIFSRLEHVSRV